MTDAPAYFSRGECWCTACGRIFGSVSAFDTHRPGRCDIMAITLTGDLRLRPVARGDGPNRRVVWVGAGVRPDFAPKQEPGL